ncbi:MAG TPA: DoxX family protein [Terriglobales bacterium]|nr:DoxX family protein [Terriglobales bacterium]
MNLLRLGTEVAVLVERVTGRLGWVPPLLARLTAGVVFFQSGLAKLGKLDQVTAFFASLGLPLPGLQAVIASTTELVCGGLLVLGLATRFVAVPLIIIMIVAIRTALWEQVTGLGSLVGLLEFSYIALLVGLAIFGGGAASVDRAVAALIARRETQPRLSGAIKLA